MKTFADFSIDLGNRSGSEVQTVCPQCSHTRKKSRARCLSVNTVQGLWICHHCDWRGSLKSGEESRSTPPKRTVKPHFEKPSAVPPVVRDWFAKRRIPEEVVSRHCIALQTIYMPQLEDEVPCLAIPYYCNGNVVNLKYRSFEGKHFRQFKDGMKMVYNIDSLNSESVSEAVVVEGELDVLACATAGIMNSVSVPDGAPPADSKPSELKFEYLANCAAQLDRLTKIILAVDNDPPGKKLEEELARRLGPERCWRVTWPKGCKDANDVLVNHGAQTLRQCIEEAKPYPLEGVLRVADFAEDVVQLYREGQRGGLSTGWISVDGLYTVRPGELTIVTGIPSHGKSEWLDALAVNLAQEEEWVFGVCSPENLPVARHVAKFIEKRCGFPFREGPRQRLPMEGLSAALQWVHDHFIFVAPEDGLTIPVLLTTAKQLVSRYGIRGLILDPWNEFEHSRGSMTETEYISVSLAQIRRFARAHGVHVWLVAHPQKLYRQDDESYPVPTPYDISGSAHWRNKADNCLTVWRDENEPESPVKLYVQKIRFREVGRVGMVELHWNSVNGRYADIVSRRVPTHWQDHE